MTFKDPNSHYSAMDEHANDELDSELALDLKGRKHVHQNDNSDSVYWLQEGTQSSYMVFPVPGKASADALRSFLEGHLPPHLITDEYGRFKPIAEIPDDHLPTLQAQVWLSKRDGNISRQSRPQTRERQARVVDAFVDNRSDVGLRTPDSTSPTNEALLFACHITLIIGLLQSNHLFVIGTKNPRLCELPSCTSQSNNQPHSASIITIEPLIHWGTVTPATDVLLCSGSIQAFRRNGDKCDDPLWTQAIKAYAPQYPTSYCSDCLNLLLEKSAMAWDALQRSSAGSFTAINNSPVQMMQTAGAIDKIGFLKSNNKVRFTLECQENASKVSSSEHEPPSPCESFVGRTIDASLNLDGACDTPPEQDNGTRISNNGSGPICSSAHRKVEQQSPSLQAVSAMNEIFRPTIGLQSSNDSSVTRKSTTVIEGNIHCDHTATSGSQPINRSPSTPSSLSTANHHKYQPVTLPTQAKLKNNRSHNSVSRKYSVNTDNSFTSNQGTRRVFGRELSTNPILKSHKDFTMAAANANLVKNSAHEVENIRKFFLSALPPATSSQAAPASTRAKIMLPPSPDSSEENRSGTSWETASTSTDYPANTSNGSSPLIADLFQAKESPLHSPRSPFPFKKFPTLKTLSTNKSTSTSVTPFFAKRPDALPCPPEISSHTYTVYTSRIPEASENICTCSRPASTPSTQIAQCANTDCTIVWYHYDCLDKSGKISARHGKLICRICKNDQEFKEKDKEMGWMAEKLVQAEMKMAFEPKDILANLPGAGGVEGFANPYGIGVPVDEVRALKEDKGALGEMAFFGYAESKPKVVSEVYTQPGKAGDRRMAEMEMEMEEDEDEYWEYSDECEEGFAEDVEEDEGEVLDLGDEMDVV